MNEEYEIADGEHRALVYKELGYTHIPGYIVSQLNDDIERRLLRQTMNKLRGSHDAVLDADELTLIFQNDKLEMLSELIAKEQETLMFIIGRKNTDPSAVKEIDGELATTNKCPQCGFEF